MKNKKKIEGMFIGASVILVILFTTLGVIQIFKFVQIKTTEAKNGAVSYIMGETAEHSITVPRSSQKATQGLKTAYQYNDRVPKDVIIEEMNSLGERFNFTQDTMNKWYDTIQCESGFNNLAKNETSTALGVAQYLIKTWEETESFKQLKIARTDYKASLFEMALDIANGETWRWEECW